MLSKNKIKHLQALHLKKFRQKYNKIIVEGLKTCRELMDIENIEILEVYATPTGMVHFEKIGNGRIALVEVSEIELKKMSALKSPNDVLMVCAHPVPLSGIGALKHFPTIYLDGIRDPGNMGTIIRTADWFGISQILISPDCAEIYSPKVIQASMGSVFRVACIEVTREELVKSTAVQRIGADMDGRPLDEMKIDDSAVVIFGNEGRGISEELRNALDRKLSIPGVRRLGAESLNVAISAGIVMSRF